MRIGCGGCAAALVYGVSVTFVILAACLRAMQRLPDALWREYAGTADAEAVARVLSGAEGLASIDTVFYVAAAAGLAGLVLTAASWAKTSRVGSVIVAPSGETAWDAQRNAIRRPALRAAVALLIASMAAALVPIVSSLAMAGGKGEVSPDAFMGTARLGFAMLLACAACGIAAFVFMAVAGLTRRGSGEAKLRIVREEIARIIGAEAFYEPDGRLTSDVLGTGLVTGTIGPSMHDRVHGRYKGVDFEQADVIARTMAREWDSDRKEWDLREVTTFAGRWLAARAEKTVPGRVLVFSRAAWEYEKRRVEDGGYAEVLTEDAEFGGLFTVRAENAHDAFYVLTPPLMERLKRLAGGTVAGGARGMLYVGFYGNIMHVGVNDISGAFDNAIRMSVDEAEARARIRADISMIPDVLDALSARDGRTP